MDIKHVIALVKNSKLLSDEEKKEWLGRMERMTNDQLQELSAILESEQQIDWATEVPKFEQAITQATQMLNAFEISH